MQFYIKLTSAEKLYVSSYVSNNISLPLNSKKIEVPKQKYDHLKEIKLADSKPCNSDLEVDILIGVDFVTHLYEGIQGSIAFLAKVGCVLSGTMRLKIERCQSYLNDYYVTVI